MNPLTSDLCQSHPCFEHKKKLADGNGMNGFGQKVPKLCEGNLGDTHCALGPWPYPLSTHPHPGQAEMVQRDSVSCKQALELKEPEGVPSVHST